MDPGSIPGRVPSATEICIAHERALFGSEIDALRSREVSANPLVRAASASVRRLVEARLEVRIEAIAAVGPGSLPGRRPGVWAEAGLDGDPGAPLSDAVAMHPLWEASIERDGPRHEAFLRGASVEFRRIGLPKAWDAYLTLFLLEAVDEIDMLAAIAVTDGPRMGEFPPEVIGAGPPETSDPTLYAAWLHRQVTLGMLRRMGVPVDERFEHVFLNAGLGEGLTPYASR